MNLRYILLGGRRIRISVEIEFGSPPAVGRKKYDVFMFRSVINSIVNAPARTNSDRSSTIGKNRLLTVGQR